MASTELSAAGRAARGPSVLGALVRVYLLLWATTLAGAALAALLARGSVRGVLRLALSAAANPAPSVGRALALAAHNLPICGWPLLLGPLKLPQTPRWRRAVDLLVLGCALANVLPVAGALGGYGAPLAPFIPQLPLEWAALAVGYSSWVLQRERPLRHRLRLAMLVALACLLLAAAALETFAVPHR